LYIPEHFRVEDQATAVAFMRMTPFCILVSNNEKDPFATHIPVVIREEESRLLIRGHVAKANPHWKYLQERPSCLIIFHGPHAYISPSNYSTKETVPTWNYGAVHAYGDARIYAETGQLLEMLHDLIPTFEAEYSQQWESLSAAYQQRMLSHIVGFEITVRSVEAKFKLSQNRTRDEQQKIIDSLGPASDSSVRGTAELMCEHGLGLRSSVSKDPVKKETNPK
jgi:transcriptional regulator